MQWTKSGKDQFTCKSPDGHFTMKASIKGDHRWSWEVCAAGKDSAMASGVANNVGGAKAAAELFVKRQGFG
jgi:hypothetical protein